MNSPELHEKLDKLTAMVELLTTRLEFLDWCDCLERFGQRSHDTATRRCHKCQRAVKAEERR